MPLIEQNFIIVPPTVSPISFSLESAHNAFHSLTLLLRAEKLSGLGEWVTHTWTVMTPEERQNHRLVMNGLFYAANPVESWPTFPAYLDHLAEADPFELRTKLLNTYARLPPRDTEEWCGMLDTPLPIDQDAVLASVETYIDFLQQRFGRARVDVAVESQAYAYVINPPALKTVVVSHLRYMWNKYLAAEWDRVQSMLQDSINAFQQIDFSQMSRLEAIQLITGQEPDKADWNGLLEEAEQIIFVPSAHVGPYLGKFETHGRPGVFFGARLPEGTRFHAPDLSRAEILVRLSALADDTRLRILRLVAEEGEQRSQDIMNRLELSQSAASRHLQQLSATGYLTERRCEGAKCYAINPERIENTLHAISAFLVGK